ncbi:MAG: hypothetical protein M1816_008085 [Peltula sp. TS41687]|nr:MAG: hypothetical protein M1816_008085 [Peltula sp. TS41687]
MAPPSALISKLKVQLKLSISRLRMVQQKDSAIAKQQRRAMAALLEQGRDESARIRVENIIRSDLQTELLEILELYCELLLARAGLLEPSNTSSSSSSSNNNNRCDSGLEEAVASIIYAAPRTEIKELQTVRQLLVERFGKEFAMEVMEEGAGAKVAERVRRKLRVEPPSQELVQSYLKEIARAYGVRWPRREEGGDDGDDGGKREEQGRRSLEEPLIADVDVDAEVDDDGDAVKKSRKMNEEELTRATPPRSAALAGKSVTVAPPSPSSDNVNPKIKLPDTPEGKAGGKGVSVLGDKRSGGGSGGGGNKAVVGGAIPDADELAARFAALKRKY